MKLREFFTAQTVSLELESESKDDLLREMVALLELDAKSEAILFKTLKRRENLGSTGIGKGIAIPHCRSLVVDRLRLAYGRKPDGVDFNAIDGQPVYNLFLIVAPPLEVSNQYLPVLGKIAQFAKDPEVPARLRAITSPAEFLRLLEDKAS
jgi:mannitol/fructose-specific phosphotransferase system IIA component (Ntr-type)